MKKITKAYLKREIAKIKKALTFAEKPKQKPIRHKQTKRDKYVST
jgi:hypothetical protein